MSLKNVDIESALRRLADRRIEEAMQQGKFDNLPGAGKPLDLEPMPAEENARLTWWALRLLKQNNITPDEVTWRKQIDGLRGAIERALDERTLIALVNQLNDLVRRLNTLGTNAIPLAMMGVDLKTELARFRSGRRRVS